MFRTAFDTAFHVAEGTVRDVARTLTLAGMRRRGDLTGRLFDPAMVRDPYPFYAWLHDQGRSVAADQGMVTADHELCSAVLRHKQVVTSLSRRHELADQAPAFVRWLFSPPRREGVIDPLGPDTMIGLDGTDHGRLRRLVSSAFTPAAVARLRPQLEAIAEELLTEATRQPSFDLMGAYARELPVRAICGLLGVPATESDRFREWGAAVAADLDALVPARRQRAATAALRELEAYFNGLIEQRRLDPGDDVLSNLIMAESESDRLTHRELIATCTLLLFAGFETTVNLIGNGAAALLDHPDQSAALHADPSLIPNAVEEMLRFDAPVQVVGRIPTADITVAGVDLAEGVPVSLMIGGANRDPKVFTEPGLFDIRRENARQHLSFAAGPHHCLGASLARLEGEVAFTALLRRFETLRPAGPAKRRDTFVLRGYTRLPLQSRPDVSLNG